MKSRVIFCLGMHVKEHIKGIVWHTQQTKRHATSITDIYTGTTCCLHRQNAWHPDKVIDNNRSTLSLTVQPIVKVVEVETIS